MEIKKLELPLSKEEIKKLKAGDIVSLSGAAYTARDAAHKRFLEAINRNEQPPIDLQNCAIYYCGAAPAKEGEIIGSCGPTTSARMDDYTPDLIEKGLRVMIGKGKRSEKVIEAMKKHGAIYFAAIGGAGALIKSHVTGFEPVAYSDLGCEQVSRIVFKDLPLIVGIDTFGNVFVK